MMSTVFVTIVAVIYIFVACLVFCVVGEGRD